MRVEVFLLASVEDFRGGHPMLLPGGMEARALHAVPTDHAAGAASLLLGDAGSLYSPQASCDTTPQQGRLGGAGCPGSSVVSTDIARLDGTHYWLVRMKVLALNLALPDPTLSRVNRLMKVET